jgi:hypothetical protein
MLKLSSAAPGETVCPVSAAQVAKTSVNVVNWSFDELAGIRAGSSIGWKG